MSDEPVGFTNLPNSLDCMPAVHRGDVADGLS